MINNAMNKQQKPDSGKNDTSATIHICTKFQSSRSISS